MPMIRVMTSTDIAADDRPGLMARLSAAVAKELGKPESYMMVVLVPNTPMLMGAKSDPSVLVEVKSVGTISPQQARTLSSAVADILTEATGIPEERIYSNYTGVPGAMWGFGSRTFG